LTVLAVDGVGVGIGIIRVIGIIVVIITALVDLVSDAAGQRERGQRRQDTLARQAAGVAESVGHKYQPHWL